MVFICLGLVRAVKNCDESQGNAVLLSLRSQFFTILIDPKQVSSCIGKHLDVFEKFDLPSD